jgi:hypothetical protein
VIAPPVLGAVAIFCAVAFAPLGAILGGVAVLASSKAWREVDRGPARPRAEYYLVLGGQVAGWIGLACGAIATAVLLAPAW